MHDHDVDALLLLGQSNVVYATGLKVPAAEMNQSLHRRAVALVTADGAAPHVWTWYPEGIPAELPADHVHPGLRLEFDGGAHALADTVAELAPSGRLAVDELTMPLRTAFDGPRPRRPEHPPRPGEDPEDGRRDRVHPPRAADQ